MGMSMSMEKAADFKGAMRKLWNYIRIYRGALIVVLLFAIASTAASIVGPKIMGRATTALFQGAIAHVQGTGEIDFAYIGRILLTTLALYASSSLFIFIQSWLMTGISVDISYRMRREIARKINRIPLSYFDTTSHGEVLSRITNDVDTVSQTLNNSLTQVITSVITMIGVLIMMLSINVWMTLASLIILPLSVVIMGMVIRRSQIYFARQQEYLGHVNGHVEEMYGGHTIVKAFNGEARSLATFDGLNNSLYDAAWRSQFISGIMHPIMTLVGNLVYVVVAILGGWLAIRNAITVGDIQAFIQYVRSFTQPAAQLANVANLLQQTAAAAERVFEFLEVPEEAADAPDALVKEDIEGHVEFDHVAFGYTPERQIIGDFSALATPGSRIAIVGPTGAGKTTMVKLLMRFYDVSSGAIRVDGDDIRSYRRNNLRSHFAMVLQDTWLYNDTIMENIRYGRADATDEEVIAAAQSAHVDHFIRTLPEGYQMVINEEVSNISEGQKQLLTIARAILADPTVLILDEATSSVDTRTEVLIQHAMERLMEGRTSFVIAHRLSTVRNADLILVMRDGDIVEQGKHDELLARGGFYAELYNAQFDVNTALNGSAA